MICRLCKKNLSQSSFLIRKGKGYENKVRHRKECKKCLQIMQRTLQSKLRKKRKLQFIEMLGGKCRMCGYKRNSSALHFHHKDPSKKSFDLSKKRLSMMSFEPLEKEIQKCILLCANCHSEFHHPHCAM